MYRAMTHHGGRFEADNAAHALLSPGRRREMWIFAVAANTLRGRLPLDSIPASMLRDVISWRASLRVDTGVPLD